MIKRVIEIGNPARLHRDGHLLVVEREGHPRITAPLEDLGFLILDHPQVSLTHGLLAGLAEAGTAVIACDQKHLPVGLYLPFAGHALHAKVLAAQVNASLPSRKRLWQRVVTAKIQAQATCLTVCRGDPGPLPGFMGAVRSGDPDNLEAQAARAYWPRLFGDEFRRDQDLAGRNALLNYGYAVVRAAVARAIVGSGLHPALGIHHCNQYNPFALADDLMEPLRPAVDREVYRITEDGVIPDLDRPTKAILIGVTCESCDCDGRSMPFLAALPLYTASVARVLAGEQDEPLIPMPQGGEPPASP